MDNKENEKKDNFVYFIHTYEKAKNFQISIPKEYKEAESLEKIKQYEKKKESIEFVSQVYRFKLIQGSLQKAEDGKYHLLILAEADGDKNYQYEIKFIDDDKDIFFYDFNIEEENYQPLTHEEQFEIYTDILRKVYKKLDSSQENENFISSTLILLGGEDAKFNFYFYLLIFLECHRTKYAQELLIKFKPENIGELGAFQEAKIKVMKSRLNILAKNINKSLNLKNAKDENELIELFYSILLYFNMNFQKEKITEMLNDDKVLEYLSKKLIIFREIYKDLLLDKDTVRKLIKKSKTFDDILIYLPYIGKNIIDFLNLIYSEFKFICDIYKSEQDKLNDENKDKDEKKEMKQIDVEKYVVTQKNDNIKKLYEVLSLILTSQKLESVKIIKFSENLVKNYVEYFNGQNMEALQLINKLIQEIKKTYINFEFKYNKKDMDLIIHETGLDIINRGEMKSNEILDFIASDIFFTSNSYKKDYFRPVTILSKIKVEEIDEQFLKSWRNIKFNQIYCDWMEKFYNTIADLIKNIKDFGILYKLFLIYDSQKYEKDSLKIMKKKYIDLLQTLEKEKCPNFVEDTIKLISLIDENKIDSKDLLEYIQNNLDFEQVKEIYLKLSEENKNLSKNTKDIIITYLVNDKNNSSPANLVDLIKKFKNMRKEIFCHITKYTLDEKDIFSFDETDNFKFFKGLIDEQIIEHDLEYKESGYIKKVEKTVNALNEKIKNFDIKYNDIITYFENEKNKNLFKGKLTYLNFLDDIKTEKNMVNLEYQIKVVKEKINNLDLIIGDFRDFFYHKHSKDIIKLSKINDTLKSGNLNCFEKKYIEEYEKFSKFLDEAKKRNKLKESTFFNEILKFNQNIKFKDDEEKALKESEKSFEELKIILKPDGLMKIDKQFLKFCLKAFKENKQKIKNEIKILAEIFNIEAQIEDINEGILLFLKQKFILDAASSILYFIHTIGFKETDFRKTIEDIIKKLSVNNDIQTIKDCNEKLIELKIFEKDENEEDNKLINILLNFRGRKDAILFLLKTNPKDLINLQEIASSNDNNYNIVNILDILDMEKCVYFFAEIGTFDDMKKMADNEIIQKIKEKIQEKKDINVYFEKYVKSYGQIKLLQNSVDRTEFIKYKIETIFKGSVFLLSNKKDEFFKCTYESEEKDDDNNKDKLDKKPENTFSREDIISFRDRALLSKTLTSEYKYFISSISEIINISNILKEIYIKGYPKIINIKILYQVNIIKTKKDEADKKEENESHLTDNLKYYVDGKSKKNFQEIIDGLKKILSELKEKQIEGYEKEPLIRYIYGRQFNLLYEALEAKNYNCINSLLKYITDDSNKNIVKNFTKNDKGDVIENNIQDWKKYLESVLKINKLTLEKIYNPTLLKNEKLKRESGVFTYVCEKPETNLFQIYKCLTGNNPIAQNILLCNKMTSNEEITAFLYRSVLCEFKSCFIIVGLESLDAEKKATILNLLNNFFQQRDKITNSYLILLFANNNSDIYRSLENKPYRKILELEKKEFEKQKYELNDIEIISSDKSGVGKTTQICLDIEKAFKKRVYFPFGESFTQENLIYRLKNLKIGNNCVLHLDLYDSDKPNLMMEVLFSILITRFYGQNEDIFYLAKDIQIKVEIPNTFINFLEKFPLLNLFNIKELTIKNLAPLIVPKDSQSCNIQIVANYLKCLKEKKIDTYDLIFPNITPEGFEKNEIKKDLKLKKFDRKSTALQPQLISNDKCQELIFEAIKNKIQEPNYYQIISFINVLAVQLKKLNQNAYLNAYTLIDNYQIDLCPIRTFIVNSFIQLTSHFTEGAYTKLLEGQDDLSRSQFGIYTESKDLNKAIKNLAKKIEDVISFDKIDPSLVFFHEKEGQSFSIITNKPKTSNEYKLLLWLKNSQNYLAQQRIKELPDYRNSKQEDFLEELGNILDIKNPVKKEKGNERKPLLEIAGDYVITADNFVKMILILIRIRSNIPVIMMGETGCGKTSLIRKLSEMKNEGEQKLKILNIHAGTNDDDIIYFINTEVIPAANEIMEAEKKKDVSFGDAKLWVFLDEINTCKSMGLISELMCKHTCQGSPLPENIVFIAACNPYRIREKKTEKVGLDINQAHNQKKQLNQKELKEIESNRESDLVYTVNPLPHSLLNFVFYFGKLKEKDEKEYIECIIKQVIDKIYYKDTPPKDKENEDNKIKILKQMALELIWEAQEYIRLNNDKSAVSLREIRRVNIFYEFFYNYLKTKIFFYSKEELISLEEDPEFYKNLDDYSVQVYSLNLSIFTCYYLRITNKEQRIELEQKMNNILKKYDCFKLNGFLDLPLQEEKFIVKNIKLDKGIAQNRALLENIFALFVTINSKIPIFIVGKPGCSKSLSMQLITKSMQGNVSDNAFFKSFPKTIIHSYQGSLSSTSKGVKNVFKKARGTLEQLKKGTNTDNIISLIYFDEMGLAEHSPNNPLKVIHSELEYDQNENDKQVAFVGISNWELDAAKMNRGISISIPEPDEEDNKETAFTIGNSYDEKMAIRYRSFFENLGKSYYNYKQDLKENYSQNGKDDFHGNRDFYHLVKNSARNMIEKEKNNSLNAQSLIECAIDSIERNFSGIQFDNNKKASLEIYKSIFHDIYPACQVKKEYDILKKIKENINDINSRYLLIASESSIGTFLLSSILDQEKKEYNFYIGSPFEQDLHSEEYTLKVMNKIQAHMERDNILILKNLETVYPSMYDLFNQNFTVMSDKNYSRLAVGSNTNTFAYVNKEFRCIVNVETSKLDEEEAPFLNRFEKHIMSFEYMMDEELIREAAKIKSNIDGFFKCNKTTFKAINYDLTKLMINCGKEEIQALVYDANKKGIKKENLNEYVLEKIALTLPQDILINLKISGPKQTQNLQKILELYKKGEHSNFSNFLEKLQTQKNIVYTFTGYLENIIDNNQKINNSLVGEIKKENIKFIQLSSFKSEREFEQNIDDYLEEDNSKVCIIKFLPFEGSYMNYIKFFIENKINGNKKYDKKIFIFVVYMSRISNKDLNDIDNKTLKEKEEFNKKILKETLSNLSGYYQIFIDNLKGEPKLKIENILVMNNKDLYNKVINPEEQLSSNLFKILSYMKYNIITSYKRISNDNYVDKLIEFISSNKRLRNLINETIFNQSFQKDGADIIGKIFKDKKSITGKEIEILTVIKEFLVKQYLSQLSLMYFKAEKDQFFSTLLSNSIDKKLWSVKEENNEIKNNNEIEEEMNLKKDENNLDKTITEKIAKLYLANLVYNDNKTKVQEKPGSNKIDIYLGFKIPGIKPVLDKILNHAKENTLENYSKNEKELRNNIDDEELEEKKKTYFNDLLLLNNSLYNLIVKEEKLQNILSVVQKKDEEEKELYKSLLNDYYYYFLINNIGKSRNKKENQEDNYLLMIDNFDYNIEYFNFMIDIRNKIINNFLDKKDISNNNLHKLAEIINWIECYSDEISSLQKIFLKLSMKIPELLEQIVQIVSSKQIQYEISERNPEYTRIVNEVFFLSLDSILRIITSKTEIYELPDDDLFDLINTNRDVLQNALQLENALRLRSKEVFSLQQILKLIDALYQINIAKVENMKIIIQYFNNETIYLKNNASKTLSSNLQTFYNNLERIINESKNKGNFDINKFLSIILLDEFNKIDILEFRETILNKILEKNDLIKNSSQIIKIIIENANIDSDPDLMIDNINSIKEEESPMFTKLNETKKVFLEEVIMDIFERKIIKYFELIPELEQSKLKKNYITYFEQNKKEKNKTGIIFDKSFDMFKETIAILNSLSNKENINENNMNLLKLYSIVYVKIYLYNLTNFLINDSEQLKSIKEIIDYINNLSNKFFSKVIKIYILKLIFNFKNSNFEEFKKIKFAECGIDFYKEFEGGNNNEMMLTFFFLPSEPTEYDNYSKILNIYMKDTSFNNNKKELEDSIDNYGLDFFLIMILNKIISNIPLSNNESLDSYKNFSKFSKEVFNEKSKFKNLSKLLFLFFDFDTYTNKLKPKIAENNEKIDIQTFEALLYGFRFCVNSLSNNKESKNCLYPSLLSKDCKNTIDKSLIPGNDNKKDIHLITLDSVKNHFNIYHSGFGCYVCSCGFYYYIAPCGFPTEPRSFTCIECKEKCGWGPKVVPGGPPNHGMVIRKGHVRIFKNQEEKNSQFEKYKDPEENIPNILLDDYVKQVEELRQKSGFGFNPVDKGYFEDQQKKIRKLSNIGYRLLNFISYCHLFYSFCLENISEEDFNKCLIQNCNILKIIKIDWDLLKESLQQKSVNIQIFINIIYKDLSKILKEYKITNKEKDREHFEDRVESIILQALRKYPEYKKKYTEQNQRLADLDIKSLKTYLTELIHPSSESYSENEYPMFKYFNYTKYKSEDDMFQRLNNKEKYPLIKQFVEGDPLVKNLSYLLPFNEFTNYMVNNYSFKISRDYAKEKELENEDIVNTKDFNKRLKNFFDAWDHIKLYSIKYKCRPDMPIKQSFSKKDKLIYFLTDDGELGNGMYLASACQKFIEWQNLFLKPILDVNMYNGILHNYVNSILKPVPVQEAKKEQIVLIKERFKNFRKYVDFSDLIYAYSGRNIFGENGEINYSDYNTFVYDYNSIEEELGKIVLPGTCLFDKEDKLNFMIYWGEGFRGGNSDILIKLYGKYKQEDLEQKEKKVIYDYILNMNKIKSEKDNENKNYDFKFFFASMQMLIFYLAEKGVMKEKELLSNIINNAPGYLKLSDDCKNFFNNEGKNFTLNKIMNLFCFFEHLCFNDLVETLQEEFKALIPEDIKNKIVEKLIKNNNPNDIISIKSLGTAVRRLISRYFAGKRQAMDIKVDRSLAYDLSRIEFWEEKIRKLDNLDALLEEKLGEFQLTISQAYEFYKIIGDEDRKSLNFNKEN